MRVGGGGVYIWFSEETTLSPFSKPPKQVWATPGTSGSITYKHKLNAASVNHLITVQIVFINNYCVVALHFIAWIKFPSLHFEWYKYATISQGMLAQCKVYRAKFNGESGIQVCKPLQIIKGCSCRHSPRYVWPCHYGYTSNANRPTFGMFTLDCIRFMLIYTLRIFLHILSLRLLWIQVNVFLIANSLVFNSVIFVFCD